MQGQPGASDQWAGRGWQGRVEDVAGIGNLFVEPAAPKYANNFLLHIHLLFNLNEIKFAKHFAAGAF